MSITLWPGHPYPLGATYDGFGTNFSIFSEQAEKVELCLFDGEGKERRIELNEVTGYCWHGYLPKIKPGQQYGYRIHGQWDPSRGQRFNPNKLLLDPYSKSIDGQIQWNEAIFPYYFNQDPEKRNDVDSAPFMPRCAVHNPFYDWTGDNKIQRPLHDTIIYEVHVKGFTCRHPAIPPEIRGTFAGLIHPLVLQHFKELGINTVELMPIQSFVHDKFLIDKGLRNYWGYNTIGFFAPHSEYCADKSPRASVSEFKELHDIEWFTMEGEIMPSEDWERAFIKALGVFLNGKTIPNPHPRSEPVIDDDFYIIFNASDQDLEFKLPSNQWGEQWIKEIDTAEGWLEKVQILKAKETQKVQAHSIIVFRRGS